MIQFNLVGRILSQLLLKMISASLENQHEKYVIVPQFQHFNNNKLGKNIRQQKLKKKGQMLQEGFEPTTVAFLTRP